MDNAALQRWIKDSGLKREAIAKRMGITRAALSQKCNGATEFKVSEIGVFSLLGMSDADRDQIFFGRVTTNLSSS